MAVTFFGNLYQKDKYAVEYNDKGELNYEYKGEVKEGSIHHFIVDLSTKPKEDTSAFISADCVGVLILMCQYRCNMSHCRK